MSDDRVKDTESGMIFLDLLILLREITRMQLGLVSDADTGGYAKNIEAARHIVNMVMVLKEKTAGNLTQQESQVLSNLLSELQMACVQTEHQVEGDKDEQKKEDETE